MALALDANLGTVKEAASLTTSAAAASDSRVFVFVYWFGTQTCTGCSGGGLTWDDDVQVRGTVAGDQNQCIISAAAPSGLASSTVITPSFSATPSFGPGIAAASFTGVETSSPIDATTTLKEDFEETWTTNNLVTATADTLLFGFSLSASNQTNTAATNYTEIHDWSPEGANKCATVYRIVSSAATYNPGGTWTGSVDFQQNVGIAYKAAAGGPPPEGPSIRVVQAGSRYR